MFQCVLFDLDGTLTDPKEGITKCVQFALYQQGIKEPDLDKLEPFIGPPLKDSFMNYYGLTQEQALTAIDDYRKRFAPIGIFENKVYPGVPEMLKRLKEAGMKLAVASSKPEVFVNRILEHFELAEYFDVVVGSNLNGTRVEKEEVVEEALRQLEQSAADMHVDKITCAMVGDRKFDVQGAREHGLTAVGVSYGYACKGELEAAGPDYIAKTVKQLEQFLLQNIKPDRTGRADRTNQANRTNKIKTLDILSPILIYFLGYHVFYLLAAFFIQRLSQLGEPVYVWMQQNSIVVTNTVRACSMLSGAGFLIPMFRKQQNAIAGAWTGNGEERKRITFLRLGILAGTSALGINILFSLLHLTEASAAYEQTAQVQYQIPFIMGLVFYGIISPLAEELLFRGLIYQRMKKYFSVKTAMLVSSCFFGLYHGNLVQALYGTLLGMLIVYTYEQTGRFAVPVFVHGIANVVVFACTYDAAVGEAVSTPLNCVIFLLVFGITFLNLQKDVEKLGK